MQVKIKQFDVQMEIKNNGVELEVASPDGSHLGDLVITKSKLIWCKGRTRPENGESISWKKFIKLMES